MSDNLEVHGLGTLSINSLPMLKVSQSQSKGVSDGTMRPGELFNSITDESFGKSVELIAYYRFDRRTKFPKRGEGTNIECFSPDMVNGINGRKCATCPKRRQNTNFSEDDLCTDQNVFIVAPVSDPNNWMLLPFMRSGFNAGKKLRKLLAVACTQKSIPLYAQQFILVPDKIDHKKSGSTYFSMDSSLGEVVKDEKVLAQLKENQEKIEAKLQAELIDFLAGMTDDVEGEPEAVEAPSAPSLTNESVTATGKDKSALL